MTINNVNYTKVGLNQQETNTRKTNKDYNKTEAITNAETNEVTTDEEEAAAVYEPSEETTTYVTDNGYTVDMEKVLAMKEEADQRMVDLFKQTVKSGALKQMSNIRGLKQFVNYVQGLDTMVGRIPSDDSDNKNRGLANILTGLTEDDLFQDNDSMSPLAGVESVEAGESEEIDEYWSAESVSDRFLDFAKALSGGDTEKADMLLDAVKKGYEAAEKIWGSELPQLSQDTLAMTIEKFESWRDGTDE